MFCFVVLLSHAADRIRISQLVMESVPTAVKSQSLNPSTAREVSLAQVLLLLLPLCFPHPLAVFLLLCTSKRSVGNGQRDRRKVNRPNRVPSLFLTSRNGSGVERGQKEVRFNGKNKSFRFQLFRKFLDL